MQARHYDPLWGRFLGNDPVGFSGDPASFNRYAYGNNNPYKYTDPDGRFAMLLFLAPEAVALVNASLFVGSATGAAYVGHKILQNEAKKDGEKPSLLDPEAEEHVLHGDDDGGGHLSGTGKPGKSEFPETWSGEKIKGEISDVATDPDSVTKPGRDGTSVVQGTRDGVKIQVILDKNDRIITGYPMKGPGVIQNKKD